VESGWVFGKSFFYSRAYKKIHFDPSAQKGNASLYPHAADTQSTLSGVPKAEKNIWKFLKLEIPKEEMDLLFTFSFTSFMDSKFYLI
jgi:hypothetical protein